MEGFIIRWITSYIIPITGLLSIKNLSGKEFKLKCLRNILLICLLAIITFLLYHETYSSIVPFVLFLLSIFIYKFIFDISFVESVLYSGIFMLLLFTLEIVLSFFVIPFMSIQEIRSNPILFFLINVIMGTAVILITKTTFIKATIRKFTIKINKNKIVKTVAFIVMVILAASIIFYIISNNYEWNREFAYSIFAVLTFLILLAVYIREQLEYERLNKEFDSFIQYVKTLEDWIETSAFSRHEYKNNLAVLRTKVTNPEALQFIDDVLIEKLQLNDDWIIYLKNVPKGGLNGLLYYKIILAKNNKVHISIDVSKNCTQALSSIKGDDFKNLCHLLGIYLDNAIVAATESRKKSMSIEIYKLKDKINFVISNTYKGKINLDKVNEKGYTTKGEGHGNGLYYAKKIIDRNPLFTSEQRLMNGFYVQLLYIDNKNKKRQTI